MFCDCRVCAEARRVGDRDVRSRTAYMLGEEIRVDISCDSFWHTVRYGLDHCKLEHLLVTHSHGDHFNHTDLHYRRKGFCQVPPDSLLHIWGNPHVMHAAREMPSSAEELQMALHTIRAWEAFEPQPGVVVTPIEGSHASEEEQALNFVIDVGGTSVLLGNDTGYYDETTWERIADLRLDIVFMDSTYGEVDSCAHHMGLPWVVKTRDRMAELGALRPDARFIATHFSHNGNLTHAELVERYGAEGIEVAYDGMEIEL